VTEDSLKDLTLFDKLRLYPGIVLDETLNKNREKLRNLLLRVNDPGKGDDPGLVLEELAKGFLESPYLKLTKSILPYKQHQRNEGYHAQWIQWTKRSF